LNSNKVVLIMSESQCLQWHDVTLTVTAITAAAKCNTIDGDRLHAQWAVNKCVKGISLPFDIEPKG